MIKLNRLGKTDNSASKVYGKAAVPGLFLLIPLSPAHFFGILLIIMCFKGENNVNLALLCITDTWYS